MTLHKNRYSPIPVAGKRPPFEKWQQRFETNPAEIDLWSKTWPRASNTGILCRLTPCLDIDVLDPDAARAVEELVRERFEDGGYVLVRTGKPPKRAIPFRTQEPFRKILVPLLAPNGDTAQKLEFLGDGQQIVVDGEHPEINKPYAWFDKSLLDVHHDELPYIREAEARALIDAAADLLVATYGYRRAERKPDKPDDDARERADWAELIGRLIAGQDLHDSVVSLSASLIAAGSSAANTTRLIRAMMLASTAPRDERFQNRLADVARCVRDAEEKFGDRESGPAAEPSTGDSDSAFGFSWELLALGAAAAATRRSWLAEGLLPQAGVSLLSGQWGLFKTFCAFDLAAAVMRGEAFIRFPVTRQGGVLLLATEGQSEVTLRMTAAWEARGGSGQAPFVWISKAPPLLGPHAAAILIAMIRHAKAKLAREHDGIGLSLVIIDALGKAAGYAKAGDENDAAVAKRINKALDDAAIATDVMVLGVTHFGKAIETGTRGSSVFEDDPAVVLALIGDRAIGGAVTNTRLCLRKNRGGESGEEFPFATRSVPVGSESTLVIDWGKEPAPKREFKSTKGWNKKSLRLLRVTIMGLLADCGREIRPWFDGPLVRALDLELVRGQFYKGYPAAEATDVGDKTSARRRAFARAIAEAEALGLIKTWEVDARVCVWLTVPTPTGEQGDMLP
jgi:AAA domain/Bifunctional DNA primase/polymerase, N-terminal